ncbi:MAG: hypothetical protein JO154_08710 [Chitinophaga sp.]|uniref:hypothetical protein n=1 Tax=Chitinophaga sp. TaxID=1869181 RepID=UPI0025B91EA2|nr:hypothetical protein [Chitinophaga sp.]MBV8252675.1 hypothetical protein [Chitinophaga sp.]
MKRNYNPIYAKIVEDDNDVVGHIAYSLYKRSKIEYIENQHQSGRTLTDADLIPFNDVSSSSRSIDHYKTKGEQVFRNFIDTVLGEELAIQKDQVIQEQTDLLKSIVKPLRTSFLMNVLAGVVASFVFGLILAIVFFIKNFGDFSFNISFGHKNSQENISQQK